MMEYYRKIHVNAAMNFRVPKGLQLVINTAKMSCISSVHSFDSLYGDDMVEYRRPCTWEDVDVMSR